VLPGYVAVQVFRILAGSVGIGHGLDSAKKEIGAFIFRLISFDDLASDLGVWKGLFEGSVFGVANAGPFGLV
jgi:hypothetical protein